MNFLTRKVDLITAEDVKKENNVKANITREFAKALKALQREHLDIDEPIYSSDNANTICNILEAIFLHGLKGSMTKKIVTYVYSGQSPDSPTEMNFWSAMKKVTHSDVVSQLRHLAQITTEVGMCRAWIRLALNDYLMESYVSALVADKNNLEYFYNKTAYLRDHEAPGILLAYLQGLMNFQFQLSYNSSILNKWTTSPLFMSGLCEVKETPAALVSSRSDSSLTSSSQTGVQKSSEDAASDEIVVRTARTRPRGNSQDGLKKSQTYSDTLDGYQSSSGLIPTPGALRNPHGATAPIFTSKDLETIKRQTLQNSMRADSVSSTSSHISCPDPVRSEISTIIEANHFQSVSEICESESGPTITGTLTPVGETIHDSSERIEEMSSYVVNPEYLRKEIVLLPEGNFSNVSPCNLEPNETLKPAVSDDIYALPPQGSIKDSTTDEPHTSVHRTTHSKLSPPSNIYKTKPLEPTLSSATVDTVHTVCDGLTRTKSITQTKSQVIPIIVKSESSQNASNDSILDEILSAERDEDDPSEGFDFDSRRISLGNSLSGKNGWSSTFRHDEKNESSPIEHLSVAHVGRDKTMSFGTLLSTYSPSSTRTATSINDVLQNLPESGAQTPVDSQLQQEEPSVGSPIRGFEMIPDSEEAGLSANAWPLLLLVGEICTEKGLDYQNYQCKTCRRPIGLIYGNPRVCSYDGGYYCFECHENDEYYIPARIVINWDFRKMKVSKKNLEFLQEISSQPLLNIEEINSKLYEHVNEMNVMKVLRQQLCSLRSYLFTCNKPVAEEFRKYVWPKEYLYEDVHVYSLQDLLQVLNGQLASSLKKTVQFGIKHVYNCGLCSQKGYICELCNSPKVIYPFQVDNTYICSRCRAVYHKDCKTDLTPCTKCQRRQQRHSKLGIKHSVSTDGDYATNPGDL